MTLSVLSAAPCCAFFDERQSYQGQCRAHACLGQSCCTACRGLQTCGPSSIHGAPPHTTPPGCTAWAPQNAAQCGAGTCIHHDMYHHLTVLTVDVSACELFRQNYRSTELLPSCRILQPLKVVRYQVLARLCFAHPELVQDCLCSSSFYVEPRPCYLCSKLLATPCFGATLHPNEALRLQNHARGLV